ncbi:uncharacterized protein LOC144123128 [Amblyomma americanum]
MSKAKKALQLPRPPLPNPTPPIVGPQQPQPSVQELPRSRRGSIHKPLAKPAEPRASLKPLPRDIAVANFAVTGAQPKARGPGLVSREHSQVLVRTDADSLPPTCKS